MPAPTLIGTPVQAIAASGTTLTFNKPAGIQNDDWLVASCRDQNAGATSDFTLTGWVRAPGPAWPGSSAGARVQGFYVHKVTDATSEPATYTFTVAGTSNRICGTMLVVRGVDPTTPFYGPMGTVGAYGGDSITSGRRVTGYNPGFANPALILFAGGGDFGSPNDHVPVTTPVGHTLVDFVTTSTNTTISRTSLWTGKIDNSVGAVGNADMTWGTISGAHACGLAIQGLAVVAPAVYRRHVLSLPVKRVWTGSTWSPPPGAASKYRRHVGSNPLNRWEGSPGAWVRKWTPP